MANPRTHGPLSGRAGLRRRVLGDGLFAGSVALLGFVVLCWPFARTPPLDDAAALAFVFGAWGALILLLAAMSGAAGGAEPRSRR